MEQSRLFKIVYHLLEKGKSTAPELAKKFEVSIRTIYRDLDTISAAGVPIYATQGRGGGIFIMSDFVLNKSLLSEQEKEQILIALQGISATEYNQTDELLIKLGGLFQSKVTNWIEVDFSEWYKNTPNYNVFNLIKNAIFNQNMITFSYFAQEGNYSNRTVEPIKLIFKNKDWYLYGFCLLRNDFRFFKLTRIINFEVLTEGFCRSSFPELDDALEQSYNTIVLRFPKNMSYRVYDEFDKTMVSKKENGDLIVSAQMPEDEWLIGYLLSFGTQVDIIEPAYLKDIVAEQAQKIYEKYTL